MQITRVTHSCRLSSLAEFVLGPDESKLTKTFIGKNVYNFTIEHIRLSNGQVLKITLRKPLGALKRLFLS